MKKILYPFVAVLMMTGAVQAALISNGDLNTAVSTAGSSSGNSTYTLDASGNVTENGGDIGKDTNEWVRAPLTRGFEYSATGGASGDGAFVAESSDTFNVTTLNDATTLVDHVRLAASNFHDSTWTIATVTNSLDLGSGYDYYASRIGVVGASAGDNFAFENVVVSEARGIITWASAQNVSSASDVSTDGILVEAFNAGASGVSDQTVNGVLFTGTGALLPSDTTLDVFSGDTGDAAYNALLSAVDFGGGTNVSLQIGSGNLEVGTEYLVQVWYVDTRYSGGALRTMRFGDGNGNTVDLDSTPGQYAIGTFTAADTNQALSLVAANFGNVHIMAYQILGTSSVPVPTLTTATNLVSTAFTVNVDFTEAVTGLQESDFAVTNGSVTASSLSGSGNSYSVEISPTSNGYVYVALPANSVTDTDGDNNQNPASDDVTVLYIAPGSDQPTVTLSTGSSNVTAVFTVHVNFSEAVTGLAAGDFVVANGSAANLLGSGAAYTVDITPASEGDVNVSLPEGAVTDVDGDNLWNTASDTLVARYQVPDTPSVTLYGNLATDTPEYDLHISFSEAVTGLESSDVVVVNGVVSDVTPQARTYSLTGYYYSADARYYAATITAASTGTVEVTLPADVVTDIDGDSLRNTASSTLSFQCQSDFGVQWIVDDEAEWTAATLGNTNLTISGGYAEPTANTSRFTSIIKTFPVKKQARTLTFQQSPVWDNWTDIPDIEPAGALDAPVIVSVEDKNYFYLARSGQVYAAWHSTNMVNWVLKGAVTAGAEGRWVTTAEYKDGAFYIYSDYFNDHTPHLFIDTNLADGVAGTYMGAVFTRVITNEHGHGSDCSLIRSDEDGLFHLIYEDWSPVKARTHSWDSPLAGHTSSADGQTGFEAHEHQPPVDHRTTPTGTYGTYDHPDYPGCIYEIHEPDQDAFGDWTSIKIGSRFYLFGDHEMTNGTIKVGRHYSDSIYGEYKLMGSLGGGHPDPTVCFAEGQFYLITQANLDHVSPGPWVNGVEARAGVDTNGNSTIDQWTAWQSVSEQYDHTPGFIRVVTVASAQLDLSSLPAGYGFQYEFRVDDTVVTNVPPIMDSVVMDFEPSNFQHWANINGIPAGYGGDDNTNGMPDGVEFAIGQTVIPERQADGTMTVTAVNEAIDDGLVVELWFTDDLLSLESWSVATSNTVGVTLLSETVVGEGDHELVFEVFAPNGDKVFWTLAVAIP